MFNIVPGIWRKKKMSNKQHDPMGYTLSAEEQAQIRAQYQQMMDQIPTQASSASSPPPYTLMQKLCMRLNVQPINIESSGFEHISAVNNRVTGTVVVFVITASGEAVSISDEAPLFPSDALLGKLNTLR